MRELNEVVSGLLQPDRKHRIGSAGLVTERLKKLARDWDELLARRLAEIYDSINSKSPETARDLLARHRRIAAPEDIVAVEQAIQDARRKSEIKKFDEKLRIVLFNSKTGLTVGNIWPQFECSNEDKLANTKTCLSGYFDEIKLNCSAESAATVVGVWRRLGTKRAAVDELKAWYLLAASSRPSTNFRIMILVFCQL